MGDKEGPRVNYEWVPPSLLPQFVPWIAVLLLLLLPANRRPQSWWVLLPMGVIWLIDAVLKAAAPEIFSDANDYLALVLTSLAFGVAVLWLLAGYLAGLSRPVAFLVATLIISASSILAYLIRADLSELTPVTAVFVVALLILSLLTALALVLSSLMCKRVYRPTRFLAWFGIFLLGGWLVISSPFIFVFLVVSLTQGGGPPTLEFLWGIVVFALLTFAVVLPFLLLSFVESRHKERFIALFGLPRVPQNAPAPPPVAPPSPLT
ncbi:MAG: hypothetical protein GX456_12460 [Verrucomicrobia bacterium]|nr:hypothetical protein [Verrucomicrobiota bacterium]